MIHLAVRYMDIAGEFDDDYASEEFQRFESYILRLAEGVAEESEKGSSARILARLMMNYFAANVLVWATDDDAEWTEDEAFYATAGFLQDGGLLQKQRAS